MALTYPTPLSPWYVIFNAYVDEDADVQMKYARPESLDGEYWTETPREAMIYLNLPSACRVAQSLAGDIMVLWSKDQLKEFRP